MAEIPEQLTLHLTSIYKAEDDPTPEKFFVTSTRDGRGVGPDTLGVELNPINHYISIKDAQLKAAQILGVDWRAIDLVDYLQHYITEAERSEPLITQPTE